MENKRSQSKETRSRIEAIKQQKNDLERDRRASIDRLSRGKALLKKFHERGKSLSDVRELVISDKSRLNMLEQTAPMNL